MGATLSTTVRMEEHAFFILFIAFVLMACWYAVWGLLDEFTTYLHKRYGIQKRNIYAVFLLVIVLLIGIFPQILKKI
jgi:hypothetical protein